ncbi:MAG: alpha/beta hydrolase [Dinoroseobacter sp.]|nr:alpha/beta hydrolase [Dinoroseobacter sp.]MDJ0993067.1 alpha/beta hydrolase [Dinoroseobacter sp.]
MTLRHLETKRGRRLAYVKTNGSGPTVVFLGGLRSDMEGTKALHLETWAQANGQSFLRFDYSGHGISSGDFEDGSVAEWAEDAVDMLGAVTEGPLVLVGSSMGGWVSLMVAKSLGPRVAGLVTVAAAPDFTEDEWWAGFSEQQRRTLQRDGRLELPSDYDDGPYVVTLKLIEDSRRILVFDEPLELPMPVRFLHGTGDEVVPTTLALRLLDYAEGSDMRLTLVDGADHRFSTPDCLALITRTVEEVVERSKRGA